MLKKRHLTIPLLIFGLSYLIYWPGVSGPFLFDDITSITSNSTLEITELSQESLSIAAQSGYAGPLKRPIALLSFALNYYFAGNYDPAAFKITNIFIHGINATLLFILSFKLLNLTTRKQLPQIQLTILATGITATWALHPINLTSVLYVVQRMTSLCTMFSLSSIILYIIARNRLITNGTTDWRSFGLFSLSILSLTAALFSKENAILIPLTIMLIELTLYRESQPWKQFERLPSFKRNAIWATLFITAVITLLAAINYAEGGFKYRPFSMSERILTETRVVTFYIFQILIPKINEFGLFHDDISLSTSIIAPWTTSTSTVFLIALIASAIYFRIKNPLYALGVGWFFIGHLLESTIFPLEIAHEHRNNLPSIGIIIAVISLIPTTEFNSKRTITGLLFISIILAGTTWLRSKQWSSAYSQAYYETVHHPDSPAAQSIFANSAHKTGHTEEALVAIKKAMTLSPNEIAFALYQQHILATSNQSITESIQNQTLTRIKRSPISPSTELALDQIVECLGQEACKNLRENYIEWIDAIIKKKPTTAYFYLFKGKAELALGNELNALNIFQKAFEMDERFLHPLFEIVDILLKKGNIKQAEQTLSWLKQENEKATIPRHKEIKQLEANIWKLKQLLAK